MVFILLIVIYYTAYSNMKLKLCEFRKFIFILKVAAHTQPTTLPSREWINDNSPELLAIDDFSRQAE